MISIIALKCSALLCSPLCSLFSLLPQLVRLQISRERDPLCIFIRGELRYFLLRWFRLVVEISSAGWTLSKEQIEFLRRFTTTDSKPVTRGNGRSVESYRGISTWRHIPYAKSVHGFDEIKGTGFTPTKNCTLWLCLPPKIFWSDQSLIWRNGSLQLMGPPSFVPLFLLVPIDYMDKTRMQCAWGSIRLMHCILVLSSRSPWKAASHFPPDHGPNRRSW
jgi:hypothetical protein